VGRAALPIAGVPLPAVKASGSTAAYGGYLA